MGTRRLCFLPILLTLLFFAPAAGASGAVSRGAQAPAVHGHGPLSSPARDARQLGISLTHRWSGTFIGVSESHVQRTVYGPAGPSDSPREAVEAWGTFEGTMYYGCTPRKGTFRFAWRAEVVAGPSGVMVLHGRMEITKGTGDLRELRAVLGLMSIPIQGQRPFDGDPSQAGATTTWSQALQVVGRGHLGAGGCLEASSGERIAALMVLDSDSAPSPTYRRATIADASLTASSQHLEGAPASCWLLGPQDDGVPPLCERIPHIDQTQSSPSAS